jgi:spoIIIJ-associated protein
MNPESAIREAVLELTHHLRVRSEIRAIEPVEGGYLVRLESPESQLLIGQGGETLRALQYLIQAIVRPALTAGERVTVDVGGYLERQAERFRREAEEAAAYVLKTGEPRELRPMNAAERRLVHLALQDHPDLLTESVGEGRSRRVVIKQR